ncbi:MAG: glucosylglycerol 3-phosphatase, partial [Cyanobacteria bacterium J083]
PLNQRNLSLDHQALIQLISQKENILIIQDLDGVCMGLVKNPLTRFIDAEYVKATKSFFGHFFVLTNGEHIGKRGVNRIIEQAFPEPNIVKEQGLYLPGLAGGGVQWQDCYGNISHLGVSKAELDFLRQVPAQMTRGLKKFWQTNNHDGLSPQQIERWIEASVLDNLVSPTINLNIWHDALQAQPETYGKLQTAMVKLTTELLQQAAEAGLKDSFFVHYAPNLGRDSQGKEIVKLAKEHDSGTTDFQFMLRGAIKEVGVLVILNHYYYLKTGTYPLGEDFNPRQAPFNRSQLLTLVKDNFAPAYMPTIIGVGDTVTSQAREEENQLIFQRGGSDRGFLTLIQAIGQEFAQENTVVYVDSSGGEVKNRQPLKMQSITDDPKLPLHQQWQVVEGPGDVRDINDPLRLNVVFPGGYQQYIKTFQLAAKLR